MTEASGGARGADYARGRADALAEALAVCEEAARSLRVRGMAEMVGGVVVVEATLRVMMGERRG